MITPLFEKKCLNPECIIIIKRKFKQQIDKINYCSPLCRHNHKDKIFQEKLKDTIKSNCKICDKELVVNREPCGKLIPRKICDKCNKKENQLKALNATARVKYLYNNDKTFRKKRKEIYIQTGKKMKERYAVEGLPKAWLNWYQKHSKIGKSKLEDKLYKYIRSKISSKPERWYPISNMFVDIFIPEKNLVIECFGDYWHMNPSKYSCHDYNSSTKRTAEEQWKKDKNRKLFMERNGYKVVELWESEINDGDYKKLDIYI
jgi:very-short-patch-repair endonuclease